MWKRFKTWLIKRLGGYTKEEYDDWSRIPIVKPLIVEKRFGTVNLHAERTVYLEELRVLGQQEAELRTRQKIAKELAGLALPYIVWEQTENRMNMAIRVSGKLVVMEER